MLLQMKIFLKYLLEYSQRYLRCVDYLCMRQEIRNLKLKTHLETCHIILTYEGKDKIAKLQALFSYYE